MSEVPPYRASRSLHANVSARRQTRRPLRDVRTRHTLEPLAWHWSHWSGGLVNRRGKWFFSEGSNPDETLIAPATAGMYRGTSLIRNCPTPRTTVGP